MAWFQVLDNQRLRDGCCRQWSGHPKEPAKVLEAFPLLALPLTDIPSWVLWLEFFLTWGPISGGILEISFPIPFSGSDASSSARINVRYAPLTLRVETGVLSLVLYMCF